MTFIPLRYQPPPLWGTSFHGKEGECHLADSPYRWLSIRKCCFPAFVISSESEKSFSFAVKKECERSGQWETLCSLCLGRTVFHANRSTREREHGKRKRSLDCARDDDTRLPPLRTTFQSSARANLRPFGAPPSMGRRENAASRTPHTDGFRYENAASPHSSFRAKARHLLRSRPRKDVRGAGNGKPSAPCAPEERCFMQTDSHMKQKMANEKDPSAPLGMTIRDYYLLKKGGEAAISTLNLEP